MLLRTPTRAPIPCKICGEPSFLCGVADFNRSCEDRPDPKLPLLGIPIYYRRCKNCKFLFSDAFDDWGADAFSSFIYNNAYIEVDPEYNSIRPVSLARNFMQRFGNLGVNTSILDYGGGSGVFASSLREAGISADTYDPLNAAFSLKPDRKFDIVTCYECLEHVPQPLTAIHAIAELLNENGFAHIMTGLLPASMSDLQAMAWWYVAPRNGHVSIFTHDATRIAWRSEQLVTDFISANEYLVYRKRPVANSILTS